jgi:hypothetical protein
VTRRRIIGILLALAAVAVAVRVEAQFRQRGLVNPRVAIAEDFDSSFQFCRIAFRTNGGDGGGWDVDSPWAEVNLSIRLSELTKTTIKRRPSGEPHFLLMRLSDDVLFNCPFIMMTEVGGAYIDATEAERLRANLKKGGFLWADDFWGSYAWEWWEAQLRKVLPEAEYEIIDLPADHPLFRAQFDIKGGDAPQIAAIGQWLRMGGGTSERGADSEEVDTRAILDRDGNIMVLMTHNTDLGDSFEREAEDPTYFSTMSVPGYAFGINTLLYAFTH